LGCLKSLNPPSRCLEGGSPPTLRGEHTSNGTIGDPPYNHATSVAGCRLMHQRPDFLTHLDRSFYLQPPGRCAESTRRCQGHALAEQARATLQSASTPREQTRPSQTICLPLRVVIGPCCCQELESCSRFSTPRRHASLGHRCQARLSIFPKYISNQINFSLLFELSMGGS
jgi:hypothetical protein